MSPLSHEQTNGRAVTRDIVGGTYFVNDDGSFNADRGSFISKHAVTTHLLDAFQCQVALVQVSWHEFVGQA